MTARIARLSSALFVAAAFAASAHAEYRCDSPQTWIDRDACKAAEQSPTALRRFVETMYVIRYSILFSDYVDAKTLQNWERRQVADQKSGTTDSKVASSERH